MKNLTKLAYALAITCSAGTVGAWTTTEGDNWSYQVPLGGNINDDRPPWEFEIPQGAVDLATDMDVLHLSGVVFDDNTEWTFPNWSDQVLFQGQLKNMLNDGAPGMRPTIEIGGVTVNDNMGEITIDAVGDLGEQGSLAIKTQVGTASSGLIGANRIYDNKDIATEAGQLAVNLLAAHPDFTNRYPEGANTAREAKTYDAVDAYIIDPDVHNQFHARVVMSEEVKLMFPNNSIPSTWTATLPIEVTIQ